MSATDRDHSRPVDPGTLAAAERLADIEFTDAERRLMLPRLAEQLRGYSIARSASLSNSVAPALRFDPRPPAAARDPLPPALPAGTIEEASPPAHADDLAFLPVTRLAGLLRTGHVTSMELTRLSLERLRRWGPRLRCLVELTEDLALDQARRADEELAAGHDRGALHGIPYGLKDLLAVPGHPTTWGAEPYRTQRLAEASTAYERLRAAGAVLVAKLSLGELAMGDVWFGGMTLDPWDPGRGSSGSSAGSASAVAAGLVPFAIGSETMGSIVSPSTRCGVVGMRPSANLVSRHGAMALAWSLDKLGPLTRSVEDAALVLQAIAGPDGLDASVVEDGFVWDGGADPDRGRVGFVPSAFEGDAPHLERARTLLEAMRAEGFELLPVDLPAYEPEPIMTALMVEAAAAFDELTRSGRDDDLAQQGQHAWPNLFRAARLVPAVEYIQANRLRTLAIRQIDALFDGIDAYLCPSSFHANLYLTNATGNPCVSVPLGFDERPVPLSASMTVIGRLYGDRQALSVARVVERLVGPRPVPALTRGRRG